MLGAFFGRAAGLALAIGIPAAALSYRWHRQPTDVASQPQVVRAKQQAPAASGCAVRSSELAHWRAASDLVVVDTRSAHAYRRARIVGSINLSPLSLRTREYLRDKTLLLIPDSGTGAELGELCGRLLASGFSRVGVLRGGLLAWQEDGGPLVGSGAGLRDIRRIGPAALARESANASDWLFVDVSTGQSPDVPFNLLRAPRAKGGSLVRAIQAAVRELDRQDDTFVVVAGQSGTDHEWLEVDLANAGIPHLYLLDGGLGALRQYESQRAPVVAAAARSCPTSTCGRR